MSYNFQIGSNPIPDASPSKLTFHQYTIYDSENWTESGYLYWDAVNKQFSVQTTPPTFAPNVKRASVYKKNVDN